MAREASYEDAATVGKMLNLNRDEVWKIVKGITFTHLSELSMAVHDAFKVRIASPAPTAVAGRESA